MAGKTHPYLEAAKISAFVFFTSVLIIFFLALYVGETIYENTSITSERVEKNMTPPGKLYSR
ncbi:hypothetical protein NQX30_06375 [Candidatus Persebacteraceae bacterium Df01]|jgi:hypothetical protein|uniref:Uncharacterized protein n=1 Tax=Candidatus Doriopsillibacter californiensis TaxID=2970740 RepID=A0ABT7QMR1_9GAMM|nr:hypothetical protein [Candidatus Persebacteraceae bacterium Df01]